MAAHQCHVLQDDRVIDGETGPEMLFQTIVEFIETQSREGSGGTETDFSGLVEAGGEEEVDGTGPQGLQNLIEFGVDLRCGHGFLIPVG